MFYPFFFYSWLIVSVVHLSKATLVMSCYMFFFKSLVKTFCSALIMSCFLFYWCLFCCSFFQSSECLAYLKHVCLMEQNGRLKNFLFTTALAESLRFWYASFLFSFSSKNFLISLLFFFWKTVLLSPGFSSLQKIDVCFCSWLWTQIIWNHILCFIL